MANRITAGSTYSFLGSTGKFNTYGKQNLTSLNTNLKNSGLASKDRQRIISVAKEKIAKTGYVYNKDIIKGIGDEHGRDYRKKIESHLTKISATEADSKKSSNKKADDSGDFYDRELKKRLERANMTKDVISGKSDGGTTPQFSKAFLEKKEQINSEREIGAKRKVNFGNQSNKLEPGRVAAGIGQVKNNSSVSNKPKVNQPDQANFSPLPIE